AAINTISGSPYKISTSAISFPPSVSDLPTAQDGLKLTRFSWTPSLSVQGVHMMARRTMKRRVVGAAQDMPSPRTLPGDSEQKIRHRRGFAALAPLAHGVGAGTGPGVKRRAGCVMLRAAPHL